MDLDEIKRALSEATPRPWEQSESYAVEVIHFSGDLARPLVVAVVDDDDNRNLIINAPTWLAELAEEVERLRSHLGAQAAGYHSTTDYPYSPDRVRTHWHGCWKERGHHNCAVAEVERLRMERAAFEGRMVEAENEVRRLAKLLDEAYGTPCEQIRHEQEIEELKADIDMKEKTG